MKYQSKEIKSIIFSEKEYLSLRIASETLNRCEEARFDNWKGLPEDDIKMEEEEERLRREIFSEEESD